jgi:hypothetical protein
VLPAGREPQRAVSDEDHGAPERGHPRRAEVELVPRVESEQPRCLQGIEALAIVGLRGLVDVVGSLHRRGTSVRFAMQS